MFSAQCSMGMCVCVWLFVKEWGTKRVSMTSLRLSWRPNRLPATAFKAALCVLHYHRAPQTWTMDPCCNILYVWPRFLTYIYNLHAYITKNGSPQAKTSCVTASVVRAAHNCGDHCHSLPLEHSSSLSAHLIWSTVCLLTVDTTVPQQPCRMCAHVGVPSLPLLTADTKTKNTAYKSQTPFLLKRSHSLLICTVMCCAVVPVVLCVSMNCETVSCEFFSAPLAPQEIPELHLSVPESWNLPSEVVCQDKSFLPPAHSRWAGVQSTQSLASSCESRQWYCQSSCWR